MSKFIHEREEVTAIKWTGNNFMDMIEFIIPEIKDMWYINEVLFQVKDNQFVFSVKSDEDLHDDPGFIINSQSWLVIDSDSRVTSVYQDRFEKYFQGVEK